MTLQWGVEVGNDLREEEENEHRNPNPEYSAKLDTKSCSGSDQGHWGVWLHKVLECS